MRASWLYCGVSVLVLFWLRTLERCGSDKVIDGKSALIKEIEYDRVADRWSRFTGSGQLYLYPL